MSEGLALFITSSIGVILVGLFFNFFIKKYNEKQEEMAKSKQEKKL